VIDAVTCGIFIQRRMLTRNIAAPEDKRIVFRIGINVGDIISDEGDIYGDGVNIAARLEALCEPGGLCISRSANDQIRDKLSLSFADMGEQTVKNITRAIGVYGLAAKDITALPEEEPGWPSEDNGTPQTQQPPFLKTDPASESVTVVPRFSIAVLPFDNLYGDASQDYFADVLVDSLTTDLALHVPNLFVIGRGSAFTYKGKTIDPRQIGRELGVSYLLQGGVQRSGSKVRVNAHLVDAQTGAQLWTERFDGDSGDLLSLEDEITARIANSLGSALYVDSARDAERRSANPDVADLVMRGGAALFLGDRSKAAFDAAEPFYLMPRSDSVRCWRVAYSISASMS
jgi:adenylate cyclase